MLKTTHRLVLIVLGTGFTATGIVGIFLPVLPTTPFLLLAAYCFSRSSDRFHRWLMHHPVLSPPIRDWQTSGVIRPRAKVLAIGMVTASFSVPMLLPHIPLWGKGCLAALYAALVAFLASRPSAPPPDHPTRNPGNEAGVP